jgi:hypothetical protein
MVLVLHNVLQPARTIAVMIGAAIPMVFGVTNVTRAQAPNIDIQQTCWTAADVATGLATERNFDLCLEAENQANARLAREWDSFSDAHKLQCVRPMAYLPSYVEWLTCLEMELIAEQLRKKAAPLAAMTALPRPRPSEFSAVGSSEIPTLAPNVLPRPRPSAAALEPNGPVQLRHMRHAKTIRHPIRTPTASIEQPHVGPWGLTTRRIRRRPAPVS